ncbi:hemolysin-III family protein [Podospora didyma]|uniref:Hemolysin-III family protein n=1 Tax=Podospora didyma TaxID=330526 RepID=A0AAE0N9A6_9PEZI|nr:hemolysin-III family protein [Podospora didyma]
MDLGLMESVPPAQPPEARKGRGMEPTTGSNTTLKAGKARRRPALLSFNKMPEWFQRESKWVLHGYRPISNSARTSFCSWPYLHNESVNIHSHLISAILFLLGEWYIQRYLTSRYAGVTGADFVAFSIFMLTAATCLSLSATYHTLLNHSQHVEHLCLRLDMLGVIIFILGDLVLGIYMTFWCEPLPRKIYWSLFSGALTIFMTMHPKSQGAKYRTFRVLMFVATGLCGVAPLIHGLIGFGVSQMMRKAFPYTMAKAGCLLSGVTFYATRFPECRWPGKFDMWGSHSIFHVLVVCAAVYYLLLSYEYMDAYTPSMGLLVTGTSWRGSAGNFTSSFLSS